MGTTPLVKDLLDLPETVRKGDFVEKIDDAVAHAERTAETFVVTDLLKQSFDRALGLVGSALRDGRSQAAYLHGSFGSGKSHFMALLSLLLRGHAAAWGKPELHELREKHGFVGKKRLLELHFHMVGKKNVESAVFGTYVAFVREAHPDSVLPGLFADEELFDDAARLLEKLGDEQFFAPMNEGAGGADDDGWGELADADRWDRARFEAAVESTDAKVREALFSALASSWFKSADDQGRYVDFDHGLVVMTRHAKELGYDGVVLFLDELILWLAHRAAEHAWLHNEVQKMVKLVEAQELHQRAIPIISFIARQRNLADMVGEEFAGAESVRLRDSLKHWEGRFDTIELEDKNLPAIVEKRILRPKDEAARKTFDEAFVQLRKKAAGSWDTLVANETPEAFRKLYPFSPALVEALVALSHSLQRQRTAIKLLVELLVYHMDDLEVGQVMGVGDLFDVLAGGEEAADGVMRARFEAAKQLYEHELLDLIRAAKKTDDPAKCQRMRDDHPVRIGCSNCPERACRADNRLAKTLLIASLVPKVSSLEDLTVRRLVQLNHGSLRSQIPDGEASLALQRLKDWAAAVGQIRVGIQQDDPLVSVRLEGVSLKPILDSARDRDVPGARQRIVRDLLFDAMDVKQVADLNKEHGHVWRNTRRRGRIRFGNVRKMGSDQLGCPSELDYQIIVDYPFDEPGYGPNDDEQVLQDYEEQGHGSWTAVWLPSFFSKDVNDLLGDLVVLEHILETRESKRKYLAHLRAEDRERAELDLDNLRNQKRARVQQAIDQAYGLRNDRAADVDPSASVEQHVRLLKPGAQLVMRVAASLGDALGATIDALLDARYPRHPKLERQLTTRLVGTLVEKFGQLVDSDDKRIGADRALVADMRGTLGELGLVRAIENAVLLMPDGTLQRIEQARNREGSERPTVGQVRRWIDETGSMGLQSIAEDLVVCCYARAEARTFVLHGKAYAPDPKRPMPDEVELDKPDLPELKVWNQALGLGGTLFAVALGSRALHGDNLKRFEQGVLDKLGPLVGPARGLPKVLERRLGERGVPTDAARLATAQSARALVETLEGLSGRALVEALAGFEPLTSPSALARQLPQAANAGELLGNDLVFGPFAQLERRRAELTGADEVLDQVDAVLRRDELNGPLADLRALANRAQALLNPPVVSEGVPTKREAVVSAGRLDARGADARARLDALVDEIRSALEKHGDDAHLVGSLEVRVTKKS
ncbi:MAG: hypothetical protein H6719_29815 [Sandaracinaceae bacterium]|nr:hypothetical protein [Sandaracinaceae bacterium]